MADELWHVIGNEKSVHQMPWPKYDAEALVEDEIEIVIQVNGKVRDKINIPAETTENDMKEAALKQEKIKSQIAGKKVVKVITTKKLVNLVVK